MNHFELFGLDIAFEIDIALIKKNYLSLQQLFHPDKAKNDIEKIEYLGKSMHLNEAYKTLLSDYLRALYLLEILGVSITEQDSKNALSAAELESIWDDNQTLEKIENVSDLYEFEKDKLLDQNLVVTALKKAFKDLLSVNLRSPDDLSSQEAGQAVPLIVHTEAPATARGFDKIEEMSASCLGKNFARQFSTSADVIFKDDEGIIALIVKLKYLTNLVGNIRNKIKTISSVLDQYTIL